MPSWPRELVDSLRGVAGLTDIRATRRIRPIWCAALTTIANLGTIRRRRALAGPQETAQRM
jgi:hypothetical protein